MKFLSVLLAGAFLVGLILTASEADAGLLRRGRCGSSKRAPVKNVFKFVKNRVPFGRCK